MKDGKFRVAWLLKILRISGGQVLSPQKDIQATSLRLSERGVGRIDGLEELQSTVLWP